MAARRTRWAGGAAAIVATLLIVVGGYVPDPALASSADSTVVWGPGKWVKGSPTGSWSYETDTFVADSIWGQRYVLEIWNTGCTGVTAVVDSQQWVGSSEIASGSHALRTMDMGQTGNHAITIGLNGTAGGSSYIWARIVRVRNPSFIVCPDVYFVRPASITTQIAYFNAPSGPTQYTMRVVNGLPNGTSRTTSGTLWLNDTVEPVTYSTGVATSTFNVSVSPDGPTNAISFKNTGAANTRIKVRVVAVDNTAPVVSTTQPVTPPDTVFTKSPKTLFAGSVTDETQGWLTIADTTWQVSRPLIATPGSFGDSMPTVQQGRHRIRLQVTDGAKLTTTVERIVFLDTVAPTFTVTAPAAGPITTTDSLVAIAGTWRDSTYTVVTVDGDTVAAGYGGNFSIPAANYHLDMGMNRIVLRAIDKLGNTTEYTRMVFRAIAGETASNPNASAPDLAATAVTSFYDGVRFLFTNQNPVQVGVNDTTKFDQGRVVVVRGRVIARDSGPLPNVTVRVLNHQEYGSTLTRADGRFDLVVNGGTQLTLRFSKANYLEGQRTVPLPVNDYLVLDDVALVGRSAKVSVVRLNAQTLVRGRFATDANGDREIRLLFQAGTVAKIARSAGDSASLDSLRLRLTEYTVGADGSRSMPALLPPSSAYTYCLDFSVDEADSIGQVTHPELPVPDVLFTKPVICFLRNFLQYPVGTAVPYGYYDRRSGKWVAMNDGWVVKILTDSAGTVTIDSDGDGQADGYARLGSLGISTAELQVLSAQYNNGDIIWRVSVSRFSNCDFNVRMDFIPLGPMGTVANPERLLPVGCEVGGSIINCEDRTLGERLPVPGTPYTLNYRSFRAAGDSVIRSVRIPVIGTTFPPGLLRIIVELTVTGKQYRDTVEDPSPSTPPVTMTWDGRDAYGRLVQSAVNARIGVGYEFSVSVLGGNGGQSLGDAGATGPSLGVAGGDRQVGRVFWNRQTVGLGVPGTGSDALGGWTLSPHHFYDSNGDATVYLGDGTVIRGDILPKSVRVVSAPRAGASCGPSGSTIAQFYADASALAYGPRGELYFASECRGSVYRVDPNGTVTRVAGTGTPGVPNPNDGPALTTALSSISALAVGPDSLIYLATRPTDPAQGIVAVVKPDSIHKIIGGRPGYAFGGGDGLLASQAWVGSVHSLAVGLDGSLSILDGGMFGCGINPPQHFHVRRIASNNIITNYAGSGVDVYDDSVGIATQRGIVDGMHIAFDANGNLYILQRYRVKRVSPDGIMSTSIIIDNGWYTQSMGVSSDGTIYVVKTIFGCISINQQWRCLRREPDGTLSHIGLAALFQGRVATPAGIPFRDMAGANVGAIAVAPDGRLCLAGAQSGENPRIFQVDSPYGARGANEVSVPSADGSEYYVFAGSGQWAGRHLFTRDAFTGAVRYQFGYDAAGRLTTIRDVNGLTTRIQRSGTSGVPIGIVAPFGQRTRLTLDVNGYLGTVDDTLGHSVELSTRLDGLLETLRNPLGNEKTFRYGSDGRLWRDEDPVSSGGWQQLDVAYAGAKRTTTRSTGESGTSGTMTYAVTELPEGTRQREVVAAGLHSFRTDSSDASIREWWPDGSSSVTYLLADARFGFAAPLAGRSSLGLRSGMTRVIERQRTISVGFDPPFVPGEWAENDSINGAAAYRVQFNANNLTMLVRSPAGRALSVTVDSAGRPLTVAVQGLATRTFTYGAQGESTIVEGGRAVRVGYDSRGRLAVIRDTLGRTFSLGYDLGDRLTSASLPGNRQVLFVPDAAGNPLRLTPPGRPEHRFEYTPVNLVAKYRPPGSGMSDSVTQYIYNTDRQLTRIYRPDGRNIALAYGLGGRLDSITIARGKLSASYASTGLVSTLTSPDGVTLTYGYNAPADTIETWSGAVSGNVSVAINQDFRVSSQRVNSANTAIYGYDADGLLTKAGDLIVGRRSDNGLIESTTLGSVTTSESYSNHGEPWRRSASAGTTLYDATYGRDSVGRITSISETISGNTTSYAFVYSDSGFLRSVSKDGVITERYSYDANGNRLTFNPPGTLITADYDAQDRLTRYGTTYYTYTQAGDLAKAGPGEISGGSIVIADTSATRYTYDPLGNLLKVRFPNGDSLEYLADGRGRRAARKFNGVLTHRWLYQDQLEPVAELNGAGNLVSRFVYGTRSNVPDYFTKGGTPYRIIADHLGSVRLVVNATTGAVVQRIDYDGYGRVTSDTNRGFQPFGYAGGLCDTSTVLVRFGVRDYDPTIGRWTTKDLAGFGGGQTSLYAYAYGDPIDHSDPTGLDPVYGLLGGVGGAFAWPSGAISVTGSVGFNSVGQVVFQFQGNVMWPGGLYIGVGPFVGASVQEGSSVCKISRVAHAETNWGLGPSYGGAMDYGPPQGPGVADFNIGGGAFRVGGGFGGMVGVGAGGVVTIATPALWGRR